MKLVIRTEKETMTSLELVDKINELRKEENNLKELQHKDLLKFIRTEFEEEIGKGKISPTYYVDIWNRKQPLYILNLKQSLRVLTKESQLPTTLKGSGFTPNL